MKYIEYKLELPVCDKHSNKLLSILTYLIRFEN